MEHRCFEMQLCPIIPAHRDAIHKKIMDQKLLKILGGDTEHYPHALERNYPRIFASLMLLWGTPEIDPYFVKLMVNERTDREGFPPDVASEIVYLSLVHAGQHHKVSKDDVWSPEARMFTNFNPLVPGKSLISWPSIPRDTALAIQSLDVPCNKDGFFRAAAAGNVTAIRMFLEVGVHLETRNDDGWTILMTTIHNGHEELAGLLIHKGAQVSVSESGGNTPLHWAAFAGRLSCCTNCWSAIKPRSTRAATLAGPRCISRSRVTIQASRPS